MNVNWTIILVYHPIVYSQQHIYISDLIGDRYNLILSTMTIEQSGERTVRSKAVAGQPISKVDRRERIGDYGSWPMRRPDLQKWGV